MLHGNSISDFEVENDSNVVLKNVFKMFLYSFQNQ